MMMGQHVVTSYLLALTKPIDEGSIMAALTQARAREYFNYLSETGEMIFKHRPNDGLTGRALSIHLNLIGKVAGTKNSQGYIKVMIDKKIYSAHRVAWLIMTGEWPPYPAFEIDHINRQTSDNRWENLRLVTKSGNQRNAGSRKNNTSGVHGVNWKPKYTSKKGDGRWVARIWNGPKHVYLGSFKSLHEAAIARKAAERALGFADATGKMETALETPSELG